MTVFDDIAALMRMAGLKDALKPGVTTILKDNISWHLPLLSANTTPWQLEGAIRALNAAGFPDLIAVHNNTVVTDPVKGLAPQQAGAGLRTLQNPGEIQLRARTGPMGAVPSQSRA